MTSVSPPSAFQPTLPARGATLCSGLLCQAQGISTHAPRTGSDILQTTLPVARQKFQPTLPARGATPRLVPRPEQLCISTHAPRTGSDSVAWRSGSAMSDFNPRSPHGERLAGASAVRGMSAISTHAPRTGSDAYRAAQAVANDLHFNPRSPHGERPPAAKLSSSAATNFNPRSPHGERRGGRIPTLYAQSISTHAPRTGSDGFPPARGAAPANFNPRSPHGERRGGKNSPPPQRKFQPTLPARGATTEPRKPSRTTCISTHAPRTGSDAQACAIIILVRDFNPRSPHGERHGGVKEYV